VGCGMPIRGRRLRGTLLAWARMQQAKEGGNVLEHFTETYCRYHSAGHAALWHGESATVYVVQSKTPPCINDGQLQF
jgi:hypothetical protein